MRLFLVALLVVFVTAARAAEPSKQVDDSWVEGYYQHPQPERFEEEIKKWQAAGALRMANALPPMAAFFSRLFQTAPAERLTRWVKFIQTLPATDQGMFLAGLRWADTSATQDALSALAAGEGDGALAARHWIISTVPAFDKITQPSPGELDQCWGAFFATGDTAYALPVIRCAVRPVKDHTMDLTRQAARWSLKSLCAKHPKLREIKDHFYSTASPEEREALDELFKG